MKNLLFTLALLISFVSFGQNKTTIEKATIESDVKKWCTLDAEIHNNLIEYEKLLGDKTLNEEEMEVTKAKIYAKGDKLVKELSAHKVEFYKKYKDEEEKYMKLFKACMDEKLR